jgi:hypothetical protein
MADFNIKVTVPDAKATEILTGITNELGYRDLEDPKPSRQAFLRQKVRDHLRIQWNRWKVRNAKEKAEATIEKSDVE